VARRPHVRDLGRDDSGGMIVQGIVALAHSLGLVPLAEGAETPEQLEAVAGAGCDLVQGFLFSRPLVPTEFAAQARSSALVEPRLRDLPKLAGARSL
jgi:EAL domain-containing protein (putative c-di-GMP-specific phosphodiesterase class I)